MGAQVTFISFLDMEKGKGKRKDKNKHSIFKIIY